MQSSSTQKYAGHLGITTSAAMSPIADLSAMGRQLEQKRQLCAAQSQNQDQYARMFSILYASYVLHTS